MLMKVEFKRQSLLTGANPGHSYTVKSPSSFSSSVDAPESGTFGSSLCLQMSHTHTHTVIKYSEDSTEPMRQRGQGRTTDKGPETDTNSQGRTIRGSGTKKTTHFSNESICCFWCW